MDTLSVACSIAGLLAAGAKTSKTLKNITSTCDIPVLMDSLLAELTAISEVLGQIQEFLYWPASVSIQSRRFILLEHVVVTLTGCVVTYSELDAIVDYVEDHDSESFNRVKWWSKEDGIEKIVRRMKNQKSSLGLMLKIIRGARQEEMQDLMSELCDLTEFALRGNHDLFNRLQNMEVFNVWSDDDGSSLWIRDEESSRQIDVGSIYEETIVGDSEDDDSATIRTQTRIAGLSSTDLQPLLPRNSFEMNLHGSKVYLRAEGRHSQSSLTSGKQRGTTISIFSPQSLAEILNISKFSLPITAVDITNSSCYIFGAWVFQGGSIIAEPPFEIFVNGLTGRKYTFRIFSTTTCLEVKEMIRNRSGQSTDSMYLYNRRATRWVPEATVLLDTNLYREDTLELLLPIWTFRYSNR